ncbi:MAG: DNRLRE domain-containing protein [Candidatus Zixiibacteriota bacterium]
MRRPATHDKSIILWLVTVLVLSISGSVFADSYTATGAADFKDGFIYQPYPANNYGGDTRVIIGKGSGTAVAFRQYLWFNTPTGTNTNVVCSLAVYLTTLSINPDTFDIFWCTRPNARYFVGNNLGITADSSEMDWDRLFNNGVSATPPDTFWTTAGGDFTTADTLAHRIIPGGSSAGWYYWVLDSVQVDSLLKGTRANYGVFIKGRAFSTLSTRTEGASTENSNSALRPWVKFVYSTATSETANSRRRHVLVRL